MLGKSEFRMYRDFFRAKKGLHAYIYSLIALAFGAKIIFYNYSVDTEEFMMLSPINGFIQWAQMGRYGLYLFKRFFTGYSVNVFLVNLGTYLVLGLLVSLICYMMARVYRNNNGLWIIPSLFATSAILLEQYNFILQSFEVVLANLAVVLSVYLVYLYTEKGNRLLLVISLILGVLGFSVYPSNYITFIIVALMMIIGWANSREAALNLKQLLQLILPYMAMFFVVFILDQICCTITLKLLGVEKIHYVGNNIPWGRMPLLDILRAAKGSLLTMYGGHRSPFFDYSLPMGLVLLVVTVFLLKKNRLVLLFLSASFVLALNLNIVLLAYIGPIRALAPYLPLALSFIYFFAYKNLQLKYAKQVLLVLILFFTVRQTSLTAAFAWQENTIFKEETQYTQQIFQQLDQLELGELKDYKLAVYGSKCFSARPETLTGDVLGHSFYDWDATSPVGSSYRISNFFCMLDRPIQRIPEAEYQEVVPQLEQMAVFPEKNSIKVQGDVILLKIS